MINSPDLRHLTPTQRADTIYAHAKSDLNSKLWRAALGSEVSSSEEEAGLPSSTSELSLDSLIALLQPEEGRGLRSQNIEPSPENRQRQVGELVTTDSHGQFRPASLGINAGFAGPIERAAARTGMPAAALATIVEAEAAKRSDGSWNIHSRNPRSSAAGLGQFLSGTWEHEAERRGTWLNGVASERGWLDEAGNIRRGARGALLALRYDAEASIQATADYAKHNVERLRKAGVKVSDEVRDLARAAYLGHHLGPGDALRFLGQGLAPSRAEKLLAAQVGFGSASRRIAAAGDATDAHRDWLNSYVDRRIRPGKFLA